MNENKFIIGIDLGTTNSVVAYTRASEHQADPPKIEIFEIPQLTAPGTVEKRSILPSFILVPGKHDVPEKSLDLPWSEDQNNAVGEYAKKRGAELPQRLIASSKSWLCNTMVDRNKPILPWECPEPDRKMSPVEASAAILIHIRDAWNHSMAAENEEFRMENQEILLTVPASFDAVARELTVQAAEAAGLTQITLLEEPQAAFYAWIEKSGDSWRKKVEKGDLVLVCDVGGGTTDFSLISVSEQDGQLSLERIAVGDHLLVGGDNMDLALAYSVSQQIAEEGTRLDSWQMRGLWHGCGTAKEKLLADTDQEEYPLTVLGRGSGLIGGTVKSRLRKDTAEKVILDGFFPRCEKSDRPQAPPKTGIREIGLVYESDPAITRHMAKFLGNASKQASQFQTPTAILFNGGIMKSQLVRKRVMDVISSWVSTDSEKPPGEISGSDFDLAVARGAAYFGLARRGRGIRIRGGLNRSYYIGIAAAMPAVPGMPAPQKAMCVGSFGMEEGTRETISDREFALVVGEPVAFDFLESSQRHNDSVGNIVEDWEGVIEKLTTLETVLDGEFGNVVPVHLEVNVTEIGTLEIYCVSNQDGRRWKLEFNVRERDSLET